MVKWRTLYAAYLGVTPAAAFVLGLAVVVGLAAVLVLGRRQPDAAFALAVVLIPIGSPASAEHTWALALAAVAPAIRWGMAGRRLDRPAQPRDYLATGAPRLQSKGSGPTVT